MMALFLALVPLGASAHPVPYSYLEVSLEKANIHGTLTVHAVDAAHELGIGDPMTLMDPATLAVRKPALESLLAGRLGLDAMGPVRWTDMTALRDRDALKLTFRIDRQPPGALVLRPRLFPYNRFHETFVNVYADGVLRQQFIFAADSAPQTYYRRSAAGALAVMRSFVPAGVHHIWIGADHLLFLFGLILLGGTWRRLAVIVTAFTIGHSITLSLAALDVINLPGRLVEPTIAFSIVFVGIDNLRRLDGRGHDWRALTAGAFGLIHGFGFASVLRDLGLPQAALGWALFSFNLGVELGQLVVVGAVGTALAFVRGRAPSATPGIQQAGSIAVVAGGAFWFVQRVFFN